MKNTTSIVVYPTNNPSVISDDELLVVENFTVFTDVVIQSQLLQLLALNSRTLESSASLIAKYHKQ